MNNCDKNGAQLKVGDKVTTGDKRKVRGTILDIGGDWATVQWAPEYSTWAPKIHATDLELVGQRKPEPVPVSVPSPVANDVSEADKAGIEKMARKMVERPLLVDSIPDEVHTVEVRHFGKRPAPAKAAKSRPAKGHAHPGNGKAHPKAKHGRK